MFAQLFTIGSKEFPYQFCKIEVGVSSGIPAIRYLGSVNQEYTKSREKFPFIFSYLGRKLPNRKIRINFSQTDGLLRDSHADLAVITGIYAAVNNLVLEKVTYCVGEVGMDGNLVDSGGVGELLYKISESRLNTDKIVIFVPNNSESIAKLYPELEIVQVSNVREVFDYFEGKREGNTTIMDQDTRVVDKSESVLKLNDLDISILSSSSSLLYSSEFDKDLPIQEEILNLYGMSERGLSAKRIGSILKNHPTNGSIITINRKSDLKEISKIVSQSNSYFIPTIIIRINGWANDSKISELISEISKKAPIMVEIGGCPCNKRNCTCTSAEIYKFHRLIREIGESVDMTFNMEEKLQIGEVKINSTTREKLLKILDSANDLQCGDRMSSTDLTQKKVKEILSALQFDDAKTDRIARKYTTDREELISTLL